MQKFNKIFVSIFSGILILSSLILIPFGIISSRRSELVEFHKIARNYVNVATSLGTFEDLNEENFNNKEEFYKNIRFNSCQASNGYFKNNENSDIIKNNLTCETIPNILKSEEYKNKLVISRPITTEVKNIKRVTNQLTSKELNQVEIDLTLEIQTLKIENNQKIIKTSKPVEFKNLIIRTYKDKNKPYIADSNLKEKLNQFNYFYNEKDIQKLPELEVKND